MTKILGILVVLAGLALGSSSAFALCTTPAESGVWRNIDTNTRSITQAEVYLDNCGDVCFNGVCPPTTYSIHLWGACAPTDCDWGTLSGTSNDGWIRTTYERSWATKHVWVKASQHHGRNYLRVWIWTDYKDGREDRASNDWFLPG